MEDIKNFEILNIGNLNEVRKKANSAKEKNLVIIAHDDNFNRKVLELKNVKILVFSDLSMRKDKLKQRDSGLNQVLCNLAYDNNIEIGIDFRLFNDKNPVILAKIIQNIKLCKKYDVKIRLVNSKGNKHDLFALMLSLGASTSMAKYAVENKFNL